MLLDRLKTQTQFSSRVFSSEKAAEPTVSSLLAAEASLDDRVEELSEEVEPFGLLDFAITVSIEAVEEF